MDQVDDSFDMYDAILVPTDGSDQSAQAADHALEIADRFDSTVHVLYVVDDRGSERMSEAVSELSRGSPQRQEMEQQREQAGEEVTEDIAQRAREANLDVVSEIAHGEPGDVITEYAEDNDIDLIVMGARGRSAVGKFLMGSVAGKVARHASTPVMLVRPEE